MNANSGYWKERVSWIMQVSKFSLHRLVVILGIYQHSDNVNQSRTIYCHALFSGSRNYMTY